ncbi:helix-turn-helix domain-containing protein [bacterium]|nr:helix-turn-helix domain-containing protein [bacterium]
MQAQIETLTASINELASAVQRLTKQPEPTVKSHPLDDMSNEEIAIVLAARGKHKSKAAIARTLGVSRRAVHNWKRFAVAWDSLKRGEKLGRFVFPE